MPDELVYLSIFNKISNRKPVKLFGTMIKGATYIYNIIVSYILKIKNNRFIKN